jgi:hypothetical protein
MNEPTFREGMELLAPLVEQSARDLAFTTNNLIDSLALECAESAALIDKIRRDVEDLFQGPYQPSASAVLAAMYPRSTSYADSVQRILERRGIHSSTHPEGS